jgi:hypothetical protein
MSGTRDGALTVRVKKTVHPGWRQNHGKINLLPEDARADANVSYIDKHLRYEIKSIKPCAVSPKGGFILGTAISEVEDSARQSPLGRTPQIVNRVASGQTSFAKRAHG